MPPLPPIPVVTTIDQVVAAVQTVVDWSKQTQSRLGYFAALYKRITIAIRAAIAARSTISRPSSPTSTTC